MLRLCSCSKKLQEYLSHLEIKVLLQMLIKIQLQRRSVYKQADRITRKQRKLSETGVQ